MNQTVSKHPLKGKKILITRARGQSEEFAASLRARGAEVVEFPTIEILPPVSWTRVDRAIERLESYDWIIFTSVNGVRFFLERLREKRGKGLFPSALKVCAIGPATADRLKKDGIRVHYMPREFIAEAILRGCRKMAIRGKRILLARAREARDVLPAGLQKMGAEVEVLEVYRTVKPRGGSGRLRKQLEAGGIDVITFTSSSTVNHFAELLRKEEWEELLRGVVIACIGPITARTAREWGMKVHIQPGRYTIPALARAIAEYFSRRPLPPSSVPGDRTALT